MTYNETEMDSLTQKYFFSGYEAGKKDERERIIALIEAKDEWHYAFSDVSDIIALIKGEN